MKTSPDFPAEPMSPDPEAPLIAGEEEMGDADAELAARLDSFGANLSKRRQEWINARAAKGIDRRFAEDLDQYNGVDTANKMTSSMMETVEQGYPVTSQRATPNRSTVFVQATRFQTNTGAARICDVILPTDERNFSIEPTPIPNMPSAKLTAIATATQSAVAAGGAGAPGSQPTPPSATPSATGGSPPPGMSTPVQQAANGGAPGAPAGGGAATGSPAGAPPQQAPQPPADPTAQLSPQEQQIIQMHALAKQASDAMQEEIEDCLDECDFNAEARRAMLDRALLGTLVMMGPVVLARTGRKWSKVVTQTGTVWKLEVAEELKPASFRIDPMCFYPDPDCGENVQHGIGAFRYERKTKKQIRLLAKQPAYIPAQLRKVLKESPEVGRALAPAAQQEDRNPMTNEAYEHWYYWGEVERDDLIAAGVPVSRDELDTVSACIEMINSTVIRAYLNPLPDGALPYDMVPWERQPGSVWGFGVPYLMRAQQRVINSAWRMLLDNAGVSSGPQIVLKQNAIEPADKNWTITSRKVWYASDEVDDVNKAFAVFEFNSHQQDLANIIDLAQKLAEAESAVPQDMGAQGGNPETLGAMQLLMNSKNVVLRRLVKDTDDCLIKPHIRRYYDYLMEYSDRDDIKGDYQVIAMGSSELVVRDIQNQAYVQMLAMGSNPVYAPFINLQKLFKAGLKAQHINPDDIMNSPAEIQQALQRQAQSQQPDPRLAAAEKRADADMQRTQAQVQMNQETLQAKRDIANAEMELTMKTLEIQREIEMMRLSQKENLTLEQIKAQLAAVAIRERSKQDMQANEIHVNGAREMAAAPAQGD